jgi:Methyltransferase domain
LYESFCEEGGMFARVCGHKVEEFTLGAALSREARELLDKVCGPNFALHFFPGAGIYVHVVRIDVRESPIAALLRFCKQIGWVAEAEWHSADSVGKRNRPSLACPAQQNTQGQGPGVNQTDGDAKPYNSSPDAAYWDQWWNDLLSDGRALPYMFPIIESPMVLHQGNYYAVAHSDDLLISVMVEHGLRTILCAGSGISMEPRALAEAGFNVTALDVSPTALRVVEGIELGPNGVRHFCGSGAHRTGGHVDFVVGSLLDMTVCPGPFDVVIERRTVQRFEENDRPAALRALAGRLGEIGILLSHCNDNQYFPSKERGLFHHASESWFRERGWTIWDLSPECALKGRVAWLVRSSG